MVDLSGNQLLDVPPAAFLAQLNIFLVDLSRNKLIRTPVGAFSRRVNTVILQENPLVCTEKVHMLQQGVAVFIPNSEDRICGGRPTAGSPKSTDNERFQVWRRSKALLI
jgi:Leucine-rich repeat (LRR) protein